MLQTLKALKQLCLLKSELDVHFFLIEMGLK